MLTVNLVCDSTVKSMVMPITKRNAYSLGAYTDSSETMALSGNRWCAFLLCIFLGPNVNDNTCPGILIYK